MLTKSFARGSAVVLALTATVGMAAAAELDPKALVYQLPGQIKWNPPSPAGAQNVTLVGDPNKPGLYLVRNKWLAGNHFSRPHFHPNDRLIYVLDGTWWVGTGPIFDPAHSEVMPAGTFVTHIGKRVHWDGAKGEDATIVLFGEGPATTTRVPEMTGRLVSLDSSALVYKTPDQFKWRDPTGQAAVNQAVLAGDPTKPGPYVIVNRFKPGTFSHPHYHPNDRFITVVKGTWWVATGNKFDPEHNMVPMPAGSFVTHFGKQVHWDGAKDEEVWLLIAGNGPATMTRVEEAK